MTFDLLTLLIFGGTAVLYAAVLPKKWRQWALFAGSVIALYWLQPFSPLRFSGYILPTTTVGLIVLSWWMTLPRKNEPQRHKDRQDNSKKDTSTPSAPLRLKQEDRTTLFVIVGLVFAISFLRFLPQDLRPIANRPPGPLWVAAGLITVSLLVLFVWRRKTRDRGLEANNLQSPISNLQFSILLIITIFIILKTDWLATAVAHLWRNLTHQDASLASPIDLTWLGFSYVAFRLLHTLRDRQTGQLPALTLRQYAAYVLFFPAVTAGPIDRAERFVTDLRALPQMFGPDAGRFADGLTRIGIGLFKKFVIADSLALGMSLDGVDVTLIQSTGHLWLLLYGYAFRLFLDFSGYTDIAIGLGLLYGVRAAGEFWTAVSPNLPHRLLAKLAHHPQRLGQVLRLHATLPRPAAAQAAPIADAHRPLRPIGDNGDDWPVARRQRQLFNLGLVARPGAVHP